MRARAQLAHMHEHTRRRTNARMHTRGTRSGVQGTVVPHGTAKATSLVGPSTRARARARTRTCAHAPESARDAHRVAPFLLCAGGCARIRCTGRCTSVRCVAAGRAALPRAALWKMRILYCILYCITYCIPLQRAGALEDADIILHYILHYVLHSIATCRRTGRRGYIHRA
jgi:hypothetical protein